MAGAVAVISVHGVADQAKNQTAVKAAELLLHLGSVEQGEGGGGKARAGYAGFEQETIRVGVEPLDVSSVGEDSAWNSQLRRHLEKYRGDGTAGAYETVRMEGYRMTKEPDGIESKMDRPVHVYELHWADTSRLQVGILNLFLGIYRLLFQTSWLGQQVIGSWAAFGKDVGRWSRFTSLRGLMIPLHWVCTAILTRFMPMLYLLLLGLLGLLAIPVVESGWAQSLLGGLGGYPGMFALAAVVVIAALLVAGSAKVWRRVPWPPMYVVVAVACFLAWNLAFAILQERAGSWGAEAGVALASWGVICLLICLFVLPGLGKRFPGTGLAGGLVMGYLSLFLVLGLTRETEWPVVTSGTMLALRMGFALLPFAWMILATSANLFLILAAVESISLWFRRGLGVEVIRRRRARLRTAVISIVMPVLLISFFNSTFFLLALVPFKMGLVDGAGPMEGRMADAPPWVQTVGKFVETQVDPIPRKWASLPSFQDWTKTMAGEESRFSDFATYASERMVVPFLEAVFLIVLLVLGYSLWVVAPAALAEQAHRRVKKGPRWERLTQALGENLSQGYRWIWSGQLVLAVCLLATQGLFMYRGFRTKEIQANDPGYTQQAPMMVLVDQFLGIRRVGASMDAEPVAVAVAMVEEPVPAVVAPPPAPVSPRTVEAPTRVVPPGEARSLRRPPSLPPGRAQMPVRSSRGEWGQGRTPIQQQATQQREEIRETLEEIFQQKEVAAMAKKGEEESAAGRAAADSPVAVTRVKEPSELYLKALTEAILFLNSGPLTSALGVAILFLAIGYVFFSRLVDPIVAGLRGGLDIALDVLNYLRPRPVEQTPRAQILSRFASLLRFLVNWRDPSNPSQGYSRIVIMAHSQGSVIASDMLRALATGTVAADNGLEDLRASPDATEGIPIRLFTMGSPLRQLYAARFPDLYDWDGKADPRMSHRGVESWWNVYRSGDYVGRMLFRDEKDVDRFVPGRDFVMTKDGKNLPVRETCIGPGAHTQYWNESAPTVIEDLDCLIACDRVESLAGRTGSFP